MKQLIRRHPAAAGLVAGLLFLALVLLAFKTVELEPERGNGAPASAIYIVG
jgi:hypothetical protein